MQVPSSLGTVNTPQDIKNYRKSSFDFHHDLGYPVVHKHKWNERDFAQGLVAQCPLHDDLYNQDQTWDTICFGTGYVGGWANGNIVYVAISDAPTDIWKLTPQGLLQQDTHPMMTAPWIPDMGDGDLIISCLFDDLTWEIKEQKERFLLRDVTPVRMRGPGYNRTQRNYRGEPLKIGQEAQIDKLPYGHIYYDVPVIFNTDTLLPDVTPPGEDPIHPIASDYTYSEATANLRIIGKFQTYVSSTERVIKLAVAGQYSNTNRDARITGKARGTIVEFE